MKQTGMIRKIDALGRIVIPKEIRLTLNIKEADDLEIFIENDNIILKKYSYLGNQEIYTNNLIENLKGLTDGSIFIADREKIITKGALYNQKNPKEFTNVFVSRKSEELSGAFAFGDKNLQGYFLLEPIIKNSIIEGIVILYKTETPTNEDRILMKIIKKIYEKE